MDDQQFAQSGFRVDSNAALASDWTIQGDAYYGTQGLYDRGDTRLSGVNILGRWTKRWSSTSQLQTQLYYDRTNRRVQRQYKAERDTVDLDVQQQLHAGTRQIVVLGGGYRASRGDDLGDGPGFFFEPEVRTSTIANAYAQDEFALKPGRVALIAGSKIEWNDFTGVELSPNLRVRVTPDTKATFWAAVSRAVRMPTRFDTDLLIRAPNGRLIISGSESFASETVIAYEAGYRRRPNDWMSVDIAAFVNDYDDLRSQELPSAAGQPFLLANGLNARTSGIEVATTATITHRVQTHASYSFLHERFSRDATSTDASNGANEANDPSHLFAIRASADLTHAFEADAAVRYASRLPQPAVSAYAELTARFGWHPRTAWDLSIIGQNLLHDRHEEFAAGTPRELFERGVYVRTTWRF
jgi:iron complex outermembrane receptor protein